LQAIINKDGTVSDPNVISCTRKGVGFEDAAMSAVTEWRYEPAKQGERVVDVYFTIVVNFSLN
jgi:TonB family protein